MDDDDERNRAEDDDEEEADGSDERTRCGGAVCDESDEVEFDENRWCGGWKPAFRVSDEENEEEEEEDERREALAASRNEGTPANSMSCSGGMPAPERSNDAAAAWMPNDECRADDDDVRDSACSASDASSRHESTSTAPPPLPPVVALASSQSLSASHSARPSSMASYSSCGCSSASSLAR